MFNLTPAPMANNSNQVQKHTEVNKVYKTSNLSMFKNIDGNRVPNLQHVNRLADSISVYGMKCNPILVNERMEIIDGQHRLMAAKEAESFVYYIIVAGYSLSEVHTLNANQKNWCAKDFMEGYANMGVEPYIKLSIFFKKNIDYTLPVCIMLCNNSTDYNEKKGKGIKNNFNDGNWVGKDFELAQELANKIRMIKPYFMYYNTRAFVAAIMVLFKNKNFDFNEFMHKVRLQPTALVICARSEQYKTLIEDIYNYRSRNKISLKY